jgi:hypothetical protein
MARNRVPLTTQVILRQWHWRGVRPSVLCCRTSKKKPKSGSLVTEPKSSATTDATDTVKGPSEDLQKYRSGEITEQEYLQSRIDLALAKHKGRLSAKRLAMLRALIEGKLRTNPKLVAARKHLLQPAKEPSEEGAE